MDRWSLFRRRFLVASLIGSVLISGCTRTVTHRIARFEPAGGVDETTLNVPEAGTWIVKVRGRGEKEYHAIDGTERYLQVGDVVGFRTGEDGVVYAVANNQQMALALSDEHQRVIWYASNEKPSEFGAAIGEVLGVSAKGVAMVGIGALLLWAASENDCDHGRGKRCRRCR